METTRTTYRIPEPNAARFDALWAKLEKTARRCGTSVSREQGETVAVLDQSKTPPEFRYWATDWTVEGEAPRYAGWTFVASLEHTPDGVIVRTVPGETLPAAYQTASPNCDHCRVRRSRSSTYIVRDEGGYLRQVGSTCVRDFLGHKDAETIARWCEHLATFAGDAEESEFYGGGSQRALDSVEYVAYVVAAIKHSGWVSRTTARNSNGFEQASADFALDQIYERNPKYITLRPTDDDRAEARDAIEWGAEQDGEGDYLSNLRVVCAPAYVRPRAEGILASVVVAYRRFQEREVERRTRAERVPGKLLGKVGEKLTVEATVTGLREIASDFGASFLYTFTTAEGDTVKWFASREQDVKVGDAVRVTATVKGHGEYKGFPETQVTRGKLQTAVAQ